MAHDKAPVYLSARSADDILSEIRPTRLKGDALQSVNGFLDELLFLVVQSARSLSPIRLKDGLLKLLPTPLGKEAILEAELELRSHRERAVPATPPTHDEVVSKDFPLQAAFELMRLKCEACTTLNEADEDTEAESRLLAKLQTSIALKPTAIPPAVFYMTAILEHICQHILSSVGRVVARDSSRTVASSHDLFIALCEDETIYSLFSRMKIHETISAQSTLSKPRRSKSFSQSTEFTGSNSRNTSPIPPQDHRGSRSNEAAPRSSLEKARARIFKGNSSQDMGIDSEHGPPPLPHKRSQSSHSAHRPGERQDERGSYDSDSSPASQNFDDHLKSGETMKFSLTPDRLQSMETFKQQKAQRANGQPGSSPTGRPPLSPTSSDILIPSSPPTRTTTNGRSKRNPVEAIDEGDEETPPAANGRFLPNAHHSTPSSPVRGSTNGNYVASPPRTHSKADALLELNEPNVPRRRGPARNRDSLDLDDIMNGAYDDRPKPSLAPKDATPARSNARELMDFLADGPPEEPGVGYSATSNIVGGQDFRKGGGRFRSMVSKLRNRPSTERLPGRGLDAEFGIAQPPLKKQSSISSGLANNPRPPKFNTVSPPTSFQQPEPMKETQSLPARSRVTSATRKAPPEWGAEGQDGRETPPKTVNGMDTPQADKSASLSAKAELSFVSPVSPTLGREQRIKSDVAGISPSTAVPQPSPKYDSSGTSKQHIDTVRLSSQVTKESAIELRQILRQAETANECRVAVDIFLARSGLSSAKPTPAGPTGSTLYGDITDSRLVEMLLGSS